MVDPFGTAPNLPQCKCGVPLSTPWAHVSSCKDWRIALAREGSSLPATFTEYQSIAVSPLLTAHVSGGCYHASCQSSMIGFGVTNETCTRFAGATNQRITAYAMVTIVPQYFSEDMEPVAGLAPA